jgi:hypothetical protein
VAGDRHLEVEPDDTQQNNRRAENDTAAQDMAYRQLGLSEPSIFVYHSRRGIVRHFPPFRDGDIANIEE